MKRLLSIIGAISLVATSTTSLVACNTQQEYTKEELEHLKKENQIDTTNETIKNNLEGIAPQEKPFNQVDNKGYYIVGKSKNGNITKFKNNILINRTHPSIQIDSKNEDENYKLNLEGYQKNGVINTIVIRSYSVISDWPASRFKSVYRGNLNTQEPDLILDENGNIKVNGE